MLMKWMANLSIRRKLTAITMITTTAAMFAASAAFLAYDVTIIRRDIREQAVAHADVIGANVTAAMTFRDDAAAAEILASLRQAPLMQAAAVFDGEGRLLAKWSRAEGEQYEGFDAKRSGIDSHHFYLGHLDLFRGIHLDGRRVGTLWLRMSLDQVYDRIRDFTVSFVVLIAVVASVVALPLASRLQRVIAGPILELITVARRVSSEKNYAIRAVIPSGRDELVELIGCFNGMLDQIQAHRDRLEEEVAARTRELVNANGELTAARDRAEAANRAKSAFLANMSHEIRTPMTAIVGYADMMLEPDQTVSDRQDCLQVIRRNSRHLLALIGDILDLSKIEADKMTVERIACDPAQIAADTVSLTRTRAMEKGLQFSLVFGEEIPKQILSDPLRLKQILMNLIGNAVKFTASGGIRLHVSCERPPGAPPRMRFDIGDTGMGMTPQQVEKLFQPFAQADDSMTRRFGGTGLGLIISRRLAVLLGGDILVQSTAGIGSAFSVMIDPGPLEGVEMIRNLKEAVLATPPQTSTRTAMRLNGRILVAEDGPDNQRLICAHLRRAGAEVVVVENGRLALERLTAEQFDLIFMDMQMPELDGYGATSELRRRGWSGPIVALTAHAMSGDRERCLHAGCTDYLTKPVDRDVLLSTAASYLPGNSEHGVSERDEGTSERGNNSIFAPDPLPVPLPSSPGSSSGAPLRSTYADDEHMREVLADFVAELPARVVRLTHLADEVDLEQLRRIVHQLKGAGGGYGFAQISALAAQAESSVKSAAPLEVIRHELAELISLIRRVEGYDINEEQRSASEGSAH